MTSGRKRTWHHITRTDELFMHKVPRELLSMEKDRVYYKVISVLREPDNTSLCQYPYCREHPRVFGGIYLTLANVLIREGAGSPFTPVLMCIHHNNVLVWYTKLRWSSG